MTAHPPRVLVIRFGAMGDLILTTPLLRALRRRHPTAEIALVTRARWAPLVAHNPHLSRVIIWKEGASLAALARDLRDTRWTHRLDLHQSLRSRRLRLHLGPWPPWGSYPKHRIARALLIRTKRNRYRDNRPVAERYFDAARGLEVTPDGGPPEVFLDHASQQRATDRLRDAGLDPTRTLIALAPGAAHPTKRWPTHLWRQLVDYLVARGCNMVVVGGPDDGGLGDAIREVAPDRVLNTAGATELLESAALIKASRCAVSGDTGLMHLATAVGTPVVALFGPTVEAFGFAPYGGRAVVLQRDMPCRPCSAHGGPACPLGHHRCLLDLEPVDVADAVRHLPRT